MQIHDYAGQARGARSAPGAPERLRRGERIAPAPCLRRILQGWAAQDRAGIGGRRHIIGLLLPGDLVPAGANPHLESTCLTELHLGPAPEATAADGLLALEEAQARLFDHLGRLALPGAYDRLGHLFLELHQRLTAAGLAKGCRFPFPIGQERLGEMLGLSEVHVNRTLAKMKADGLLLAGPGWYALPDRCRLQERLGVGQPVA